MLRSGKSGRATKSVISSGGASFVSVARGNSVYSNNPPSIRSARLSISILTGPSSLRLPSSPSGRAGDLEARHMELLAEAIQPRWASVTGVALQIVLAGKRGHTLGGRDPRRRDQRDADSGAHERGGHRHARERAFEHTFSSRGRQ